MRKGQAHDLEDAHECLRQHEEVIEYGESFVNFCVPTCLTFCLQLVDLHILSGFAGAKTTAEKRSRVSVRAPSRESCTCRCKND